MSPAASAASGRSRLPGESAASAIACGRSLPPASAGSGRLGRERLFEPGAGRGREAIKGERAGRPGGDRQKGVPAS